MDKKLIVYLAILVALIAAIVISTASSKKSENGTSLSNDETELLLDTGHFDESDADDGLIPLYEEGATLSPKELGNGETPSPELAKAYKKFRGDAKESSPILTFALFIITGIFTGFLIITYVLPNVVQRASEEVFGSSQRSEGPTALSRAQASVAQGDWDEAITNYQQAAQEDPSNRLPWIEIAMLQRERLENPPLAIQTLDEALLRGDWRENDEAFFLFRKIEIFEDDLKERDQAVALLKDIIERFPQTRHSANATHKLHELGA